MAFSSATASAAVQPGVRVVKEVVVVVAAMVLVLAPGLVVVLPVGGGLGGLGAPVLVEPPPPQPCNRMLTGEQTARHKVALDIMPNQPNS